MIPIGIDRPNRRNPRVVPVLIGLNIGVFVLMLVLHASSPLIPGSGYSEAEFQVLQYSWVNRRDFLIWTLITSALFRGGFMHLFGNMLALFVFGPSVEDRFGRVWFLVFYLAGAAGSALAHVAVDTAPAIGASGAIAAVTGAFLVLFPLTRVKVLMFFGFIGIFMIPAVWLIGLYIALDLFSQAFDTTNGVANMAHIGGYALGIIVALILLWTHKLSREPYDLFTLLNNRRRRMAFQAAHNETKRKAIYNSKPNPRADELALARSAVSSALAAGQMNQAVQSYATLVSEFADLPRATTLHRGAQYQLANHLYSIGERRRAADAYEKLLDAYPNDSEREVISVLLARIKAHDLDDRLGAIKILNHILQETTQTEIRSLVEQELTQIKEST